MTTDASSDKAPAFTRKSGSSFPWRLAALVVGDAASFLLFAAVGRRTHNEASGISALVQIAETALPFALGWFAVSPLVGAFRRLATRGPRRMLLRTELAWVISWPVALLVRWALAPDHNVPVSFAIVILLANAVFLGVWRTVFALIELWRSR
ncbi:MAG: DUF3054 domain-containing protein [Nitrososphaerota archaeon]